ncbi:MAG: indolepyruvate oxidoreductase subunit beta, partial [Planctomycetota bacterium]
MSAVKSVNVMAVGVGGQGIIRLSGILADAAFAAGFDVKNSEIHGLSQRGGSVTSYVRWGEKIHTPVIMDGEATFVVALEELEALRWAHVVSPEGLFLVNDFRILPATVITGSVRYPENLDEQLATYAAVERVEAAKLAEDLGNVRASNTVLLGALSKHLDIAEDVWRATIDKAFPEKHRELNRRAFEAGR